MSERRGTRRQSREIALQAIFVCDFHSSWNEGLIDFCFEHFCAPKQARVYARQLCMAVMNNLTKIDSRITAASEHWSVSRMARVDRSILRIALSEMFVLGDVPVSVAIDEAVEISKHFSAPESPMFINGVLDRAASSLKTQVEVIAAPQQPIDPLPVAGAPAIPKPFGTAEPEEGASSE